MQYVNFSVGDITKKDEASDSQAKNADNGEDMSVENLVDILLADDDNDEDAVVPAEESLMNLMPTLIDP